MRLQDNIDFTTLAWVKPELDETLRQAQRALEEYVEGLAEGIADPSRLRLVAGHLHQVQGTLRMVELYGAAMVAEEMEQLVIALQGEFAGSRDAGYSALMRGIMQLPDYLERLQSGHRDIPMVLLPLLNELRDARGVQRLSEAVLFSPDLSRQLPETARGPAAPVPDAPLRVQVEALRGRFQAALLQWLREDANPGNIEALTEVCERLVRITQSEDARRLFWVAAGTLEALRAGAFEASRALKQALGRVEREIKRLAEGGDAAFRNAPPLELTRQLLYFVAHAPTQHVRIDEIRDVFGLSRYLPSEAELDHARGSLAGHNRALLDTVSSALKDDLLRVKDALDLHLRAGDVAPAELEPQLEVLDRVGDTLGMLGLGVPRRVVQEQRQAIADFIGGTREANEGALLDVAGALLYVEATLDDQVARLGAAGNEETASGAEARRVLESLIKEAIANFANARQCFVAFVETNWDHEQLQDVPRLVDEVVGALRIAEIEAAPDYLVAIRRFTETELLQRRRVPNGRQMDTLADALAALEYFLEALRDQRPGRDRILDVARYSLEVLGYWPLPAHGLPATPAPAPDVPAAAPAAAAPQPPQGDAGAPAPPLAPDDIGAWLAREAAAAAEAVPAAHVPTPPAQTAAPAPAPAPQAAAPVAPSAPAPVPASVPVAAPASVPPPPAPVPAPVAPAVPAPAPVVPGAVDDVLGFERGNDDIDDEIREVFLEEFQEEIENLDRLLPGWRGNLENMEQLRSIRRVFHTLKGSGRLVGAKALGEFSWKVENMLNRVLDGSRPPSEAVRALVDRAFHTLPQLLAALRGEQIQLPQLGELQDVADRLAAGEEAELPAPRAASAQPAAPVVPAGDALPASAPQPAAVAPLPAAAAPVAPVETPVSAPVPPETGVQAPREPAVADAAGEGVPASVDAVLFEILKAEVAGHLVTVQRWLDDGAGMATDPLLRAVHTMNGAFAMTEVPLITEVLGPLEGYIKRLLGNGLAADDAGVALVRDCVAAVRATVAGLDSASPHVPRVGELPARAIALRDSLPVPPGPSIQIVLDEELDDEALPSVVELDVPDLSGLPRDAQPQAPAAVSDAPLDEAPHAEVPPAVAVDLPGDTAPASREEAVQATAPVEVAVLPDDALLQGWDDVAWDGEIVVSEFDVEPEDTRTPATAAPVSEEPAPAGIAAADPAPADEAEAAPASPVAADGAPTGGTAHHDDSAFAGAPDWQVGADGQDATGQDADAPLAFGPEDLAEAERAFADAGSLETAPVSEEPTWDFAAFVDADALASVEAIQPEAPASADANADADADADASQAEHAAAPEVPAQAGPAFGETEGVDSVAAHATGTPTAVAAQGERAPAQAPAPAAPVDPDAPLDLDGVDVELLDIFLEEAADLLDHSDGMLATLRETPSEREAVIGLQRDLHTLKGGARMAGLHAIGELGHSMETLLEAVAENRLDLDGAGVGLLERAFDRLQVMVERTGARRAVAFPQQLIAELEAAATGQVVAPVPAAPAQAPTPDMVEAAAVPSLASTPDEPAAEAPVPPPAVPVASAPTAAEPVDATESASADAPEAQPVAPVAAVAATRLAPGELPPLSPPIEELEPEDDAGTARAPQEQVRIRADLLDRLVNYAGEVAIYRARLEQQLGAFRGNLGELDQTIGRLREQLRRLEIETEAQIASRYQREQETGDPAFDPLELDRFSTQQQLTRGLAETAADLVSLQGVLDEHTRQYETLLVQQSRVSSDLQEGLMRTRMVPFESLVPRLRRVLRQAAAETGKQVQLRVDGAQGEMDRNVLEHMTAPLEHMLRNAVAHGIETPDVRAAAGKPEEGTVRVAVAREGSEVVLTISDDGRGMNREAIRTKAIERGLLAEGSEVSDADLYAFTLEAGFSTAGEVSRLAGRGVGMDVVHNQIRQLGGSLSIASQAGRGAEFSVRLPFTLAVTQAVFVRIGETSYAVPIASVRGVGRIERAELESQLAGGRPVYRYADEDYAIHDLGQLLGMAAARAQDSLQMPLLLLRSGDMRAAICVDQVQGSREIVVKPVGPQVNSIPGIFGATIMGDGRVVVILDVAPLVRRQLGSGGAQSAVPQLPAFEPRHVPLVMVVDDSITMRKVTGRVLERHNLEVLTAKDGVDAIEKLAERVPDLMLLDIEMPRMDGYELATHMKNDPRLREIPIVMITSRTGDKHRQRAFEIGVDRYLGKPYQEADLMHHVYELLSLEVAHG